MKSIVSNIALLLHQYDCVIIPGFGGFISNYRSAKPDVDGLLLPPAKDVAFNKDLNKNDGLLINAVSREQGISYEEAERKINIFAHNCRAILNREEVIQMPEVGKFYLDMEHNLQFQPESTNFLADAFGLPNVHFHPIQTELVPHSVKTPVQETPIIQLEPKPIMAKKGIKWSRIMLLAACCFIVYFFYQRWNDKSTENAVVSNEGLPYNDDLENERENHAGIIDLGDGEVATDSDSDSDHIREETPAEEEEIITANYEEDEEDFVEEIQSVSTIAEEELESNKEIIDPVVRRTGSRNYTIVLGCFGSKNNVDKLSSKIEKAGYTPSLGWKGELRRVGISLDCHPDDLDSKLAQIRSEFKSPSAWVMK